jgi:hypothetical protein
MSAWTGGGRGEDSETVGCEEFGAGEEGGEVASEEVRVEVSLERLDEGGEVGGLVPSRHFCLEVERSEDLDLEEVEFERVERSLRSLSIKILQSIQVHHYQQLPTELNNAINQASWYFPS